MSAPSTVVVTSRSFGSGPADPAQMLQDHGLTVVRSGHRHDLAELAAALGHAVGWIAGTGPIRSDHLDLAPHLRIIARYGVGTDAIDRQELARREVMLSNTPGANTDAVADHTIGLMLAALRGTLAGDRAVRDEGAGPAPGRELGRCTVGLLGYGAVGRAVHQRLRSFGSRVLIHDPYVPPGSIPADAAVLDLVGLVSRVDILSLHAPPGPAAVVDDALLRRCGTGMVVVNTARAELLDERAVARALTEGRLAAAALDVLSTEQGGRSPLLDAPNVTLTPHLAGQTRDAIDRMGMTAAEDVVRVVRRGLPPKHLVPEPDDPEVPS